MTREAQKIHLVVEFDYETPVYEGDPDDIYELAALEHESVQSVLRSTVNDLDAYGGGSFRVQSITPIP